MNTKFLMICKIQEMYHPVMDENDNSIMNIFTLPEVFRAKDEALSRGADEVMIIDTSDNSIEIYES